MSVYPRPRLSVNAWVARLSDCPLARVGAGCGVAFGTALMFRVNVTLAAPCASAITVKVPGVPLAVRVGLVTKPVMLTGQTVTVVLIKVQAVAPTAPKAPLALLVPGVIAKVIWSPVTGPPFALMKAEVAKRVKDIMSPESTPELADLQDSLSKTLKTYVPDAGVEMQWSAVGEVEIPLPRAEVRLVEHGYPTVVTNTGHGLQRAFVFSMLQNLAAERSNPPKTQADSLDTETSTETDVADLILGVEEPELFQHPPRQRHFANILYRLANDAIPGVSQKTQVIYTTHSPHFVGMDRFHQVRVCQKADNGLGLPRVTRVTNVTGERVAEELGNASESDQSRTWNKYLMKLHTVMTPLSNEGFFSQVAVLVEDEEDRAVFLSVAKFLDHDLEAYGISVIPCGGKNKLSRPLVIFRQFGIKTYVVWDSDHGAPGGMKENRTLMRLHHVEPEDCPETQIRPTFACLKHQMQQTLATILGRTIMKGSCQNVFLSLSYHANQNRKTPRLLLLIV